MDSANTSQILYSVVTSEGTPYAEPEEAKELRHHLKNGKGFTNPWDSYREWSGPKIMVQILWRMMSGKSNKPDTTPPTVTVRKPSFLASRQTKTLRATWLGHACYYVEFPSGFRVLFDPVFTERCSPFSWLGPKRFTEMPCQIEDIPIIDACVISHSHYDHLSLPTVTKIRDLHPGVHFFAPLGNKKWFTDVGIHNMTEMDWWETKTIKLSANKQEQKVKPVDGSESSSTASESGDVITAHLSCLPCQHTSARTAFDKSKTLWGSWSVESGGKKVWFGGDTGYRAVPDLPPNEDDYSPKHNFPHCPAFAQIGLHRGPFDLGLVPIGAYDPRWIMSPMHANPKDAVNIFRDTRCKRALGIHWGTWVLTEEDVLEPPRKLKEALRENGISETGVFDVCDIGESREIVEDDGVGYKPQ